MPQFQYAGYNTGKKKMKGKLEARDKQEAFLSLKQKGIHVTELEPYKQSILTKDIEFLEAKVKKQDFVLFCRQFSTLLRASVGIAEALQVLLQQTTSKILKKALVEVLEEVRSGSPLSKACQSHPKVFPVIFISMVRAGEASGGLDDVLEKLATFFEKENSVVGKIKAALVYPIAVTILSVLVTFFLMWKVVPQFISTFQNMGLELPLVTRIVIKASHIMSDQWYLFVGLPVLLYLLIRIYSKSKKGRYQIDFLKLKIPVFGGLLMKSAMARFSRTFCTLYQAAVPIIPILTITSDVVGNEVVSKSLEQAKENLRAGQPLAQPFRTNPIFPPMVVHMLAVGEKTGNLDLMMGKVADFYEEEVERMADQLKSLIEPLMLVIVSGIVGIIVLAILLPTFSLYSGIK